MAFLLHVCFTFAHENKSGTEYRTLHVNHSGKMGIKSQQYQSTEYACTTQFNSSPSDFIFLCVHVYSILMRNADPKLSYWSSEEVEDVDSSDLRRNRFVGEGLGLLVVEETT